MISLNDVSLRRGSQILLHNVNWTIYPHERIGIIGANGSGKTSLFALLLNQLEPESGDINFIKNLRFAYVKQETPGSTQNAIDYVLDGDEELRVIQKALWELEQLPHPDGAKIAALHDKLHAIDGYSAESRAAQLLAGLNFNTQDQQRSVAEFSGGWRMRLNLAQALMCRSDILLLDEPTNHLDLDTIYWLESWLKNYTGTLLLISHDREFLDGTVNRIAHLYHQQLKIYTGNYSTFEKQRAIDLQVQQATYEKQQKHVAHMQSFVDRFRYKASKARQAQSRLKAIERLVLISAVAAESPFSFEFKDPGSCSNPLIQLDRVYFRYEINDVLKNVNLSIAPKERIGVLGPNGAGKSTLIKLLAGLLVPTQGQYQKSSSLRIGYFAQHQVDALRLDESPLHHLKEIAANCSETDLRKFLGGFDFSGDKVFQPIINFSGGEKSRLALALLVWQKPHLLLLDEPTNHLDMDMRNALNMALQDFEGAMVLVSHDRFLLRATTDKLLLVAHHEVNDFKGDLGDYQVWLNNYRKEISDKKSKFDKLPLNKVKKGSSSTKSVVNSQIKKTELEMAKLQKNLAEIDNKMADSELYQSTDRNVVETLIKEQAELKKAINILEESWLELHRKLEQD